MTPIASRAAVIALACGAGALCASLGELVLDGVPHIADGVSYTFQGRILASGRLWLSPPIPPEAFEAQTVILNETRWCSLYTPGWPLLLALGWWLGAPQWTAPLLMATSVYAIGRIGGHLWGASEGVVAAALLAVSPFALLMGASHMAHVPTLAASALCGLALLRAWERGRLSDFVVAGALGGLAVSIRPISAVALLWPAALAALWLRRADGARPLLGLAAGVAAPILLLLLYQWLLFGHPFTTGYESYNPTHTFRGMGGGEASFSTIFASGLPWYLARLGEGMWGLPGSDWLLLLPLLWLAGRRELHATEGVLAACAASLIVVYALYFYRDVAYGGPRLVFEAMGPLALLAGRGLVEGARALRRLLAGRWAWVALALQAGLATLIFGLPLGTRLPEQVRYHGSWYHGNSGELMAQVESSGVGPEALVLFDGPPFAYGSLLLENALRPDQGGRVFVRYGRGPRAELLRHLSRPEIWRLRLRLAPLPGPNFYTDRWQPEILSLERVALTPPALPAAGKAVR